MHGETLPIIAILFEIISEKGKLHICFHIAIYYMNADGNYAFFDVFKFIHLFTNATETKLECTYTFITYTFTTMIHGHLLLSIGFSVC